VPRVSEVLRERVEDEADAVLAVYFDALGAEKAVTVGYGEDAVTELVPDYYLRLRAADALLDRAYGKPRQVQEITGEHGGPVRLSEEAVADPEVRKAAA
jgi:hypothetical protein